MKPPLDPSQPLRNNRYEQFSVRCAQGQHRTEAYKAVGFSKKAAAANAQRLTKIEYVAARIEYLKSMVAGAMVEKALIDREWVLMGLRNICENKKLSASARVRAYELCGKEIGMFRDQHDHNLKWDGDLSKLDGVQLQRMTIVLEQVAYGGDPEKIAEAKAQALKQLQ